MTESTTPRPYERTRQIMRVVAEAMVEGGGERGFALQDAVRAAIETLEDELAVAVDGLSDGMPKWQSIETAPKGGGADLVTDPAYVDPPEILLFFPHRGLCRVGQWDAYYATGGGGEWMSKGRAWMEPTSGENLVLNYDEPTHWMSLPEAPK